MFQLSRSEYESLISQFVTSKKPGRGGIRKMPYAFTEQGVAMLSGILNSDRAIAVNIQIMRTFTRLRQAILDNADLRKELEEVKHLTDERFTQLNCLRCLCIIRMCYEVKKMVSFIRALPVTSS